MSEPSGRPTDGAPCVAKRNKRYEKEEKEELIIRAFFLPSLTDLAWTSRPHSGMGIQIVERNETQFY